MSRSRKVAIVKDRPRNTKKSTLYWRHVRRVINQTVSTFKNRWKYDIIDWDSEEDIEWIAQYDKQHPSLEDILPNPKSIVNDYTYQDYIIDFEKKQPWNKSIFDEAEFMKYWNESRAKHRRK